MGRAQKELDNSRTPLVIKFNDDPHGAPDVALVNLLTHSHAPVTRHSNDKAPTLAAVSKPAISA